MPDVYYIGVPTSTSPHAFLRCGTPVENVFRYSQPAGFTIDCLLYIRKKKDVKERAAPFVTHPIGHGTNTPALSPVEV